MFLRRLDPRLLRTPAAPVGQATVSIRYLGTAGFVVEGAQRTLVLDPFLTRPGLLATGLRPLRPDGDRLRRYLPRADDVLVGHAHHDHALDAPLLCQQTGARLIGSPDVANIGRAAGLPDAQIIETQGRETIACGAATVYGAPSRHGRVYLGRVTLPGHIPAPPPWPPRLRDLRHGLVLNWLLEIDGVRIFHIDSADFISEELEGLSADVLCLCAIGRRYRPRYVAEAVARLRPRYVIACHWDWFFAPYEAPPRLLPGVDLAGFISEIEETGAEPVVLPFEGRLQVPTHRHSPGLTYS